MTVRKIKRYLKRHWSRIEQALLEGTYSPMPVKRKEIPKPGGVRLLGIPTVLDRVIQQAVAQVLNQIWDHTFSEYSFGFRPNRSQHDAIRQYREYVRSGKRFVVDIDLSKFFDRVNHDRLMSRLATRIKDKRVLLLIRSFLTAGVMLGGLVEASEEGTPQGGPLSPLLSNIVLDELDKELEMRGLCFVRYADDCVIFVRSERAGRRVMESVSRFIEKKLRLQVNQEKSAVGRPWERKYLGFCVTNSRRNPKIRIHWKTIKRFKDRVREITARRRGRSISQVIGELKQFMSGWWNYFGITESFNRLRPLQHWVRRRLRAVIWKHWKNRRTRVRELLKRGVSRAYALTTGCARRGPWRMSKVKWVQIALPDAWFKSLGLVFPWI
ncbi:MAG: group II intron reverse transcriptase/maturase [Deltaproteobacteria bacterium]|nr:group II intron reverse transcriptase/maturase [Deltaproteobacteria bacterium]